MVTSSDYYFRGRSEHLLDTKGRLNIPARFREVLRQKYDESLMVTNWRRCLKAFPAPVWEKYERELLRQQTSDPDLTSFMRYVISGVTECPVDKQGRILLPPSLRGVFGIEKEVVVAGIIDKFEIWSKVAWEEEWRQTNENFDRLSGKIANLGI